ncbi:MerR family transcriptional regulator [Microbacterium aquimaris]|uniref:Helix-turn-helix domain-containing protein n=1 Tax=Microbacterium aquimaris TaxID=459816 RepID=A0ABU5N3F4_9MICO|nr:helix-turn-helix domain-containing protein [Microbacterium aquimaris]MDZ8160609.1 helix-turn-helix domain-containing protein [Microbacterium aquimaris]
MLSIGEFARIVGVSVRMLRHYDRLGILVPARVDAHSGYRSYSSAQLPRANQLVALKDLGFSLEQVGSMLDDGLAAERVQVLLEARRDVLRAQVAQDTLRLARIEAKLRLIEKGPIMSEFTETALPALTLVGVATSVASIDEIEADIGPLFDRVNGAVDAVAATRVGPGVATYDVEGDGMRVVVGEQVGDAPVPAGLQRIDVAAADRAVSTRLEAPDLSGIQAAWQGLMGEVERRGVRPAGAGREIYLQTPFDGPDASGWVIDLQQPVV